jgi:hypothetical protein
VSFLLGNDASYINATTLPVDGGLFGVLSAVANGVDALERASVG